MQRTAAIGDATCDRRGVIADGKRSYQPLAVDEAVFYRQKHVGLFRIEGLGQRCKAFELIYDSLHVSRWSLIPDPGARQAPGENNGTGFTFDAQRCLRSSGPKPLRKVRADAERRLKS